jgi:MoaA/NifB/PqqE/SkfB family radical SAM enzyme
MSPATPRALGGSLTMDGLTIELTNVCNRTCVHCIRNKVDPPEFLPLALAREILVQAEALGFRTICFTGGEVALYPHLEELLALVVEHGFTFSLVTNGHRFQKKVLPFLRASKNREKLETVCFSLDGTTVETHDALRGPGSFREVLEAATLCKLAHIPFSLKSFISNFNKEELTDLALLGADLGTKDHGFLHSFPSPRLLKEGVIPSPGELHKIAEWIANNLAKALKHRISVEGYGSRTVLFTCQNVLRNTNVDFQGNLILCCNLSHVTQGEGIPSSFGQEWLADLKETPLKEGIIRHFQGLAQLMEARLRDMDDLEGLTYIPCYWCFKHFGKLDWLRDFPESPWAAGVLEEERSHAPA